MQSWKELNDIASKPSHEYIFKVENFDALRDIQNQLKEKIFAIEGKSQIKVLLSETLTCKYLRFLNLDPHVIGTNPSLWVLISNIRSSNVLFSLGKAYLSLWNPGI